MEQIQKERYLIGYIAILFISFFIGPHIGLVTNEVRYNITCLDTGEVEWFNESTQEVCGKPNPLHVTTQDPMYDINYVQLYNLT